jgi:hypothetical protein
MPKFTYEVDTDERTTKAFVNGNEVDASEFSVGCYTTKDCSDSEEHRECYLSITHKVDEGSRLTYSYSFRNGSNASFSEAVTRRTGDIAKQVAKFIGMLIAGDKLEKRLMSVQKK